MIHHRKLKFHVKHGMIVDKNHEKISFKQSKQSNGWKKIKISLLKNEIKLKTIFKKTSRKFSKTHFMEKQWKKFVIE